MSRIREDLLNDLSDRREARKAPETFTGEHLRSKEFPPITWAVPDMLPTGVTLFGGREKMGKSWLAFSLCIAVATGGVALGTRRVEQGDALYLSLEDSERRLNRRVTKLASPETDLSRLHYTNKWEKADRDGVEDLDLWLEAHPYTRIVVIDTLKRIRPTTSGKRNMYDEDYEAVQPFVPLADKHDVAIVLIHHLNQQSNPDDPYDWFSGSAGLVAAAEGILLFRRKRGEADGFLTVDGKDIEERSELALKWDGLAATWSVIGDAEEHRLSETRKAILQVVADMDGAVGPKDVADVLDLDQNTVRQRMYQMSRDGELKVVARGKYVMGTHNLHNVRNVGDEKVMKVTEDTDSHNLFTERENTDTNNDNSEEVMNVMEVMTPHNIGAGSLSADERDATFQRWIDEGTDERTAMVNLQSLMESRNGKV